MQQSYAMSGVVQRVQAALLQAMEAVRTGGTDVWMVLIVLGLFYGVIHSLLPGHRKTVLLAYFLAHDAPRRHGVLAGVILAALHAITALGLVFVGYSVLHWSLSATVEQATAVISRITASFAVLLGTALIVLQLRELLGKDHDHHNHHHHHHACEPQSTAAHQSTAPHRSSFADQVSRIGLLPALIVAGVVPCPGATGVLLIAVAIGAIPAGVVVVLSMSVGMAFTLTLLTVLTITLKARMKPLLNSALGVRLHIGFEFGAATVILAFGLFLLFAAP